MNRIIIAFILLMVTTNYVHAGCGSCRPSRTKKLETYSMKKGLVERIPYNNKIAGDVFMSCGMCNFMTDDNNCSLAIKVGRSVLKVDNIDIDAHGDSHSSDGYCNVIKKTYVEGSVSGNKFFPTNINGEKVKI